MTTPKQADADGREWLALTIRQNVGGALMLLPEQAAITANLILAAGWRGPGQAGQERATTSDNLAVPRWLFERILRYAKICAHTIIPIGDFNAADHIMTTQPINASQEGEDDGARIIAGLQAALDGEIGRVTHVAVPPPSGVAGQSAGEGETEESGVITRLTAAVNTFPLHIDQNGYGIIKVGQADVAVLLGLVERLQKFAAPPLPADVANAYYEGAMAAIDWPWWDGAADFFALVGQDYAVGRPLPDSMRGPGRKSDVALPADVVAARELLQNSLNDCDVEEAFRTLTSHLDAQEKRLRELNNLSDRLAEAWRSQVDRSKELHAEAQSLTAKLETSSGGLKKAEAAIAEYYRYWTGGETRGSYDGKPERNGLWQVRQTLIAALASTGAEQEEGK